jgi:hypothetical protein
VLLTVKQKKPDAFERNFAQLKTFYGEYDASLGEVDLFVAHCIPLKLSQCPC